MYLAHHAVHAPIEAKPQLVAHYQARLAPGLRHNNPQYAAMVHSLDESVGRVRERLERNKLADHTVIIFLSDNGGHIGQFDKLQCTNNAPLRSGKGSLYEGGVRVPFLVHFPGVTRPGRECAEPVSCTDLHATLADIAGLPATPEIPADGLSLAPLLSQPMARLPRPALYFHFPHYYPTTTPVSAVRARDWKLIEYLEDGRAELYHLADDLGEQRDVSADQPGKVDELRDVARLAHERRGADADGQSAIPPRGRRVIGGSCLPSDLRSRR